MNKTIIEMAREAGFAVSWTESAGEALQRFAEIVRADEREECAKLFEPTHKDFTVPPVHFSLSDTAKIIRARGNT